MSITLSPDILDELERTGGRPLRVVNPNNDRAYLIVAEDKYLAKDIGRSPSDETWTDAKNRRRFALIDKEIAGTLTMAETAELATLQEEIDVYLRRVAPLPIEEMRALHQRLQQSLKGAPRS